MRDFRTKAVFSANSNRVSLKFSAIHGSLSVWYFELLGHLIGIYMNMEKLRVVPVTDLVDASIEDALSALRAITFRQTEREPPPQLCGLGTSQVSREVPA